MHPPSPGPPAPETPALPYTPGTRTVELCEAASAGNLQAVQRLLDVGTSVDAKDASGFTPLHRAVQHGHQQIARRLLSHGADTSATTVQSRGASPPCISPQRPAMQRWRASCSTTVPLSNFRWGGTV